MISSKDPDLESHGLQRGSTVHPKHWRASAWQRYITWKYYVHVLMQDGLCRDAAVISTSRHQLLAAHEGGILENLTAQEIGVLLGHKRDSLPTRVATLGGERCLVIRDGLYQDGLNCMDLRTMPQEKKSPHFSITIAKANKVCLILIGSRGIQGGTLNMKAFEMTRQIRDSKYQ